MGHNGEARQRVRTLCGVWEWGGILLKRGDGLLLENEDIAIAEEHVDAIRYFVELMERRWMRKCFRRLKLCNQRKLRDLRSKLELLEKQLVHHSVDVLRYWAFSESLAALGSPERTHDVVSRDYTEWSSSPLSFHPKLISALEHMDAPS